MKAELLEILDENGKETGEKIGFIELHKKSLWHKCAHVWIFNSDGYVLLQKRSQDVHFPGLLDISAAGHITAGDTAEETALKEMHEELGIKADKSDLKYIGIKKTIDKNLSTQSLDKEINHIFFLRFNGDLANLKLSESEIESIKVMNLDEFESAINDPELYKEFVAHGKAYYFYIIEKIREEIK